MYLSVYTDTSSPFQNLGTRNIKFVECNSFNDIDPLRRIFKIWTWLKGINLFSHIPQYDYVT